MKYLPIVLTAIITSFIFSPTPRAEPLTRYRQSHIETARENINRHQWARDIVEQWKSSTAPALEKDRTFYEDMIAPLTPWPLYGQSCPACVGRQSTEGETGLYRWSVDDPDHITCKYCGTVFPNDDYPETGRLECPIMGQTFTYYETPEERANPADKSGKHAYRWAAWPVHTSFSGILRHYRASWCITKILPCAKLYAITGNVRYAETAALILDVVASRYPRWLFHSYNGTYADCPPAEAAASLGEHPRGGRFPVETIRTAFPGLHTKDGYAELNNGFWGAGRFGCSGSDGGLIRDLTIAYDLIRGARKANGAPVITPEMNGRIVNDLIIAGCEDSEHWSEINNKCGPGRAMSAAVGILFGRPESVRRAKDGFEALMDKSFHFDGFCRESPSYSAMHLNLLRDIPEILTDYSDPPGWRDAAGNRLNHFNPFTQQGRYRLALESMVRMLDANDLFPVIGDTHAGSGINPIYAEILVAHYGNDYAGLLDNALKGSIADTGSEYALWHRPPDLTVGDGRGSPKRTEWFPGWHVGVLRGEKNTALYYNGYEHGGHRHYDTLGIAYSAFGVELASDRGYIWDDPRNAWTKSTLAHNIVEVDGMNQQGDPCVSTLDYFGATPFVEVVSASATAYGQCDEYRRTTALVPLDDGASYVVDVFRVSGGKRHRYTINCNGTLTATTGMKLKPATDMKIKWLDNLRFDTPRDTFSATWNNDGVSFDCIMLTPVDTLIVADAPGWRNNRGEHLNAPPIKQLIAERTDDTRAESIFASVMVAYTGNIAPVRSVGALGYDAESGSFCIQVKLNGHTDRIVFATDEAMREYGPLQCAGKFAFTSVDETGVLTDDACLINGTHLKYAEHGLSTQSSRLKVDIAQVDGRTYRLAKRLDGIGKLPGNILLVNGTGFDIESWTPDSITVRDYPAIDCDSAEIITQVYYRKQ